MSTFEIYARLGIEHILDPQGYDHMLFLTALTSLFLIKDWRKVLILVTAFTIGHSITLALAVYDVFMVNSNIIEFLIPVTIFITALFDLFGTMTNKKITTKYLMALGFGCVHGLGFSNYLKALLGKDDLVWPLLSFNIGLEIGQVAFILLFLLLGYLLVDKLRLKHTIWIWFWLMLALLISTYLMIDRFAGVLQAF